MPAERPFSVKTAAEFLGCSEKNVRNLCRAGKLRHFRVGCTASGPIRISVSAMAEYVEQRGEQCELSYSAESSTPTSVSTANRSEQVWARRIVRLQSGA